MWTDYTKTKLFETEEEAKASSKELAKNLLVNTIAMMSYEMVDNYNSDILMKVNPEANFEYAIDTYNGYKDIAIQMEEVKK